MKWNPPSQWLSDSKTEALVKVQQKALREAFSESRPVPRVGDVWISAARWHSGPEEGLAAMLVVLRAFTEAWSAQQLLDVAPISEEDRLASEWSLVLGPVESGIGMPVVLHVDVQCTTLSSMLERRLGALEDSARVDLEDLMRAYAMGESSELKLRSGRTGRSSIRFHPEWEDFSNELIAICRSLAVPSAVDRENHEASRPDLGSEYGVLLAASGAGQATDWPACDWEYRDVVPYLHCSAFRHGHRPRVLGEAIASYFLLRAHYGRTAQTAPDSLGRDAYDRLAPFLNEPLQPFLNESNPGTALLDLLSRGFVTPPRANVELAIAVESVRFAKKQFVTQGLRPMQLAARRSRDR